MAAVVAVVGRCASRAPGDGSRLGLEAIARARLLLGCECVCVPVPVLFSFRAMRISLARVPGYRVLPLTAVQPCPLARVLTAWRSSPDALPTSSRSQDSIILPCSARGPTRSALVNPAQSLIATCGPPEIFAARSASRHPTFRTARPACSVFRWAPTGSAACALCRSPSDRAPSSTACAFWTSQNAKSSAPKPICFGSRLPFSQPRSREIPPAHTSRPPSPTSTAVFSSSP